MKTPESNDSESVEYKPIKRENPAETSVVYSERSVSWEEQKQLGPRYWGLGENTWPAAAILQERSRGSRKQYLVSWEPHPLTNEVWKPSWEPARNVTQALRDAWRETKKSRRKSRKKQPKARNKRQTPPSNGHPVIKLSIKQLAIRSEPESPPTSKPATRASSPDELEIPPSNKPATRASSPDELEIPPSNKPATRASSPAELEIPPSNKPATRESSPDELESQPASKPATRASSPEELESQPASEPASRASSSSSVARESRESSRLNTSRQSAVPNTPSRQSSVVHTSRQPSVGTTPGQSPVPDISSRQPSVVHTSGQPSVGTTPGQSPVPDIPPGQPSVVHTSEQPSVGTTPGQSPVPDIPSRQPSEFNKPSQSPVPDIPSRQPSVVTTPGQSTVLDIPSRQPSVFNKPSQSPVPDIPSRRPSAFKTSRQSPVLTTSKQTSELETPTPSTELETPTPSLELETPIPSPVLESSRQSPVFRTSRQSSVASIIKSSGTIEIAETPQEVSREVSEPAGISVNIPPVPIDKADYNSLHSSQLRTLDGSIAWSPETQCQALACDNSFPPGPEDTLPKRKHPVLPDSSPPGPGDTPPKRKHPVLPDSSYETNSGPEQAAPSRSTRRAGDRQNRHSRRSVKRGDRPYPPSDSALPIHHSPQLTASTPKVSQPHNGAVTNHQPSPAPGWFKTPQYVPSTGQHYTQPPFSAPGGFQYVPGTGQHYTQPPFPAPGGFKTPQYVPSTGQHYTQPPSPAPGGFKTPQYVPIQPREAIGDLDSHKRRRILTIAELAGEQSPPAENSVASNTFPQQNGICSSLCRFQTQVPVQRSSGRVPSEAAPKRRNRKRKLSTGSRPPVGSQDSLDPVRARMASNLPLPGSSGVSPDTAPPPTSLLPPQMQPEQLPVVEDADITAPYSSNKMELSGDAVTVSPADLQRDVSKIIPKVPSQAQSYDMEFPSSLPIQKSIEEETQYSNDEQSSNDSKAGSSQQSVDIEQDVDQVDGLIQPRHPILGPAEYALALPAEGKIQSTYLDTINAKRKALLKFINRHESIGSSNGSLNRTHERNEMIELIQRLHDTTTHLDLGLPGFGTQYSIQSEHHTAYANYAGSKFSFLGHLVDVLQRVECSIIVMSREGRIQDLLEHYLTLKHVSVTRQDRLAVSKEVTPERPSTEFQVHLVSTMSTHQVSITPKPILMIAFDASFDAQDPQVMRIRRHYASEPSGLIPVIHLLISNSSEHVDRCLPKSMPSPLRLKALVRATYQARPNLGGKPTYVPDASDEPEGRPMDFSDLQRALRKSPERKLVMLASIVARASLSQDFDANWTLGPLPELQLTEIEETPPKVSGVATVADTPKEALPRSRTPASRAETPAGRKRLLEVDGALPPLVKRQRVTPLRDVVEASNAGSDESSQLAQFQELVNKLQADLAAEKEVRQKVEAERNQLQEQLNQWKKDHAGLQRRYEKRMTKCHALESANEKLLGTIESNKARQARVAEDNSNLKKKMAELQEELTSVRNELKDGGGDAAALEEAREEARSLLAKNTHLEKSLEFTRKDFEFTRSQYQDASNKAAEFANQVRELEEKVVQLTKQAGDERRRLKETNFEDNIKRHLAKISELELERKTKDMLLRKLEEENRTLKRNRGVQTRGSSVQPPGSPGLDGHGGRGPRSRPSSPAPGLFVSGGHHPGGSNRGSLLRHER